MSGILPSFPIDVEGGPGVAVSRTRGGRVRVDIARTTSRTRGTGNTYLVDVAGKIDRLRDGLELIVQPDRTNDGPVFLSIDGLGTQSWRDTDGAEFGEAILRVGRFYRLFYDLEAGVWRTESVAASIADIRSTREQAREGVANTSVLTPQTGRDLLEALLGSTSVKATGLATAKSVEDWLADSVVLSNGFLSVADRRFGARPDLEAAINTAAFQAAIDLQFARGGGIVWVPPGEWKLARTKATDGAYNIVRDSNGNHVGVLQPGPLQTALILRKGVTLMGQRLASHLSAAADLAILSIIDGDGQGVVGLKLSGFTPTGTSGSAAGINLFISTEEGENKNLIFDDLEIGGFGGYGIAAGSGNMSNNRYTRLHVHHTGADAIDHKARTTSTNPYQRSGGVTFEHLLLEFYGQRANIDASSGIDIRGPASVSHLHCRNFARAGTVNVGFRISAGIQQAPEYRQPGDHSIVENFRIEGDPENASTGAIVLSAAHVKIGFGNILNCTGAGVRVENASSAYGTAAHAKIVAVTVEGTRGGTAFDMGAERADLIGCTSRGAYDEFSAKRGTLVQGQAAFSAPRGYDPSTVQVYRNGVAETGFVATNGRTVTLASPVLATDTVAIVTPNAVGIAYNAPRISSSGCSFEYTTAHEIFNSAGSTTYGSNLNRYAGLAAYRTVYSGESLASQVYSPDGAIPNSDYRVEALGTGGFEARSRGARAFRATNGPSTVNWMEVSGSATGQMTRFVPAGADIDIGAIFGAKGAGSAVLGLSPNKVGFFGSGGMTRAALPAAAIDAATTQALVNAIRSALLGYNLCSQ